MTLWIDKLRNINNKVANDIADFNEKLSNLDRKITASCINQDFVGLSQQIRQKCSEERPSGISLLLIELCESLFKEIETLREAYDQLKSEKERCDHSPLQNESSDAQLNKYDQEVCVVKKTSVLPRAFVSVNNATKEMISQTLSSFHLKSFARLQKIENHFIQSILIYYMTKNLARFERLECHVGSVHDNILLSMCSNFPQNQIKHISIEECHKLKQQNLKEDLLKVLSKCSMIEELEFDCRLTDLPPFLIDTITDVSKMCKNLWRLEFHSNLNMATFNNFQDTFKHEAENVFQTCEFIKTIKIKNNFVTMSISRYVL